jgi:hypothetical protein
MSRPQHLRDLVPEDYPDRERYPLLAQQMGRALYLLDAPSPVRLVGYVIALDFANRADDPDWPGGSIFPSVVPVLVKATGLADRTIRNAIAWLEEHGVLVRTGRARGRVPEREAGWSRLLLDSRQEVPTIAEDEREQPETAPSGTGTARSGEKRQEVPTTPDPRPRTRDPLAVRNESFSADAQKAGGATSAGGEEPQALVAREARLDDDEREDDEERQRLAALGGAGEEKKGTHVVAIRPKKPKPLQPSKPKPLGRLDLPTAPLDRLVALIDENGPLAADAADVIAHRRLTVDDARARCGRPPPAHAARPAGAIVGDWIAEQDGT